MESVTTAGAGAALVSPWWLPALSSVSNVAAWCLPILGCTWLIMQMYFKLKERNEKSKR